MKIPFRLQLSNYSILGVSGNRIFKCQTDPCNADEALKIVGQMVQIEKGGKSALVLKNLSEDSWNARTAGGKEKEVAPGEAVPFMKGIIFTIGSETIRIMDNGNGGD